MSTPTLNYANPRVFLEDVVRYRCAGTLAAAALLATFGLGLAAAMFADGTYRWVGLPFQVWTFGFAAVFLLGAGYFAALYLSGREDQIQITEDGIRYGRRFWPWDRVEWVGGIYEDGDGTLVSLVFRTRPGDGLLDGLTGLTTPTPLTSGEFARLTRALEAYLSHHNPRVKVERLPLPSPPAPGG